MHKILGVAVVLGAKVQADGTPTMALRRRVMRAVQLFHEGRVAVLVLSGGPLGHPRPEAEVMAELVRQEGVPEEHIILEPHARNTRQNARFSTALLSEDVKDVLVVTDLFHLPRALLAFWVAGKRKGLRFIGVPASGPQKSAGWCLAVLREFPALAADLVRVWRT